MADDLIPHTHGTPQGVRRSQPYGKTLMFYKHVAETHGEPYARSWMNAQNCDFTDDTIFTTSIGRERLMNQCEFIASKHDVMIFECPHVRKRFKAGAR